MQSILYFLSFLFILASCKTTYTADALPAEQLTFGNGGGFSGLSTRYILLENGQFFKHQGDTMLELTATKPKTARQLYQQCEELGIDTIQIKSPGNIYYFIGRKAAGNNHEITWGSKNYKLPENISAFYQSLKELTAASRSDSN